MRLLLVFLVACADQTDPQDAGMQDTGIEDTGTRDTGIQDTGVIACPTPTAGPTTHSTGSVQDERWTADGNPHLVTADLSVYQSLVLEPCVEVRLAASRSITVRGTLRAEGTSDQPVLIAAMDPSQPFAQIRAVLGGGTVSFAYTKIENGGDPLNSPPYLTGTIFAQGVDGTMPTQETVHVDHVEISGSRSNGIHLIDGAGFSAASTDLTINGAASYPVSLWSSAVGTLPAGDYTGNTSDEILIPANEHIRWDTTMRNRGVPYHIGNDGTFGDFRVMSGDENAPALLTIEPGVTLRFKRDGIFKVEHFIYDGPASGALIAVGTADAPITLTSAEPNPAPGDWYGLWFTSDFDPRNRLEHVIIEYAGRESASGSRTCHPDGPGADNAGAVRFNAYHPPGSAFITDTTIVSSAGHGFDRGWEGAPVDFLPTNTFTDVAGCWQSWPNDGTGCPDPAPCPM
jgi:hypothetical protein